MNSTATTRTTTTTRPTIPAARDTPPELRQELVYILGGADTGFFQEGSTVMNWQQILRPYRVKLQKKKNESKGGIG